jgi:hypothetical protein
MIQHSDKKSERRGNVSDISLKSKKKDMKYVNDCLNNNKKICRFFRKIIIIWNVDK